ncbi:uncharacterized protein NFIA_018560 [Aspergillus fischeri NRRL 181]|uniref:Helicase C-terminal domain-containing protein n=1 Tax=Neosartorya fischeri (strain ATCC 1020 / DSM 3700 / CBS 544.65 / FGSC A1164 / JCM 1740 / NRRL 181 / WB 181) TaxID=331117 RepID=A1D412_NEOFI|nr:uncharacterized protein NFIA_018560 [Aspergillus fischeri NRRL 181]EAW23155.1 hypothetical protein NFIA_018560 [Aspergillus fischeri NRRL 181]
MKEMNERLSIIQQFNEGRCRILITCRIGLSGICLHGVNSVILDRPPERWADFLAAVRKAGLIAAGKAYVILDSTDHAEVERFQAIMTNFYQIERGAVGVEKIDKSGRHSFGPKAPTTKIVSKKRKSSWRSTTANYSKAEPYSLASVVTSLLESHVILPALKSLNQLHSRKSQANMSVLLTLGHILKTAVALVGRHFPVRRGP